MTLGQGNLLHNRYRISEILGRGGMGAVYRATDESLGVEVAVKENLFTTDDYARQFRMEAVILASLRHSNLPRVTDHFVIDGQGQYLVMDYIEGDDLRQRLEKSGTISETEAIRIGSSVCDALAYLHSRKPPILHRDIKLGNIKLTPDGGVYLVDFGLAKMGWENEETITGARAMTPGYSPPEQYGSARTDARSDVYSLGATLYAAITGVVPEDSLMRAMDGVELTPLRKHKPTISARLEGVLHKALETTPTSRYQTAQEFRQALVGQSDTITILDEEPKAKNKNQKKTAEKENVAEKPEEPPKKKGFSIFRVLGWVILLSIISIAVIMANPANANLVPLTLFGPPTATFTVEPSATETEVLATETLAATATLTATSTQTPRPTFTSTPKASPTLEAPSATPANPVQPVGGATATPQPATATPISTPIGGGTGEIGFSASDGDVVQVFLSNADGTDLRQVTSDINGACNFDWSPDGTQIVYVSPCFAKAAQYPESNLYIYDLGLDRTVALTYDRANGDFEPSWSPDGTKIVFTSLRDGTPQIYLLDLVDSTLKQLTLPENNVHSRYPVWSPDGKKIVYTAQRFGLLQIWTMNPDGSDKIQLFRTGGVVSDYLAAWSPDGSYLMFSETNAAQTALPWLMRLELGSDKPVRIAEVPQPAVHVAFSYDGEWIAYETTADENQDIYLFNLVNGKMRRLTLNPYADFDPSWRP